MSSFEETTNKLKQIENAIADWVLGVISWIIGIFRR
jgi:hypothetical protein